MSSDVMIICKDFKNSFHEMMIPTEFYKKSDEMDKDAFDKLLEEEHKKRKPVVEAVCIDEASMGDPWTSFGSWFVDRFYSGPSMAESIMVATSGGDQHSLELFRGQVFSQADFEAVKKQMDETGYADSEKAPMVLEYLQKCIGKQISTENW